MYSSTDTHTMATASQWHSGWAVSAQNTPPESPGFETLCRVIHILLVSTSDSCDSPTFVIVKSKCLTIHCLRRCWIKLWWPCWDWNFSYSLIESDVKRGTEIYIKLYHEKKFTIIWRKTCMTNVKHCIELCFTDSLHANTM